MAGSFLKTGSESRKAVKEADKKQKEQQKNQALRFWVKPGTERRVTFLDGGELDSKGRFQMRTYLEHQLFLNGSWFNYFVCIQDKKTPCPICEEGNTAKLVAAFSIIDHTKYKDKMGKTRKNERRLFIAKRQTQKLLEMQAIKRDGLAGCTFDIARSDEEQSSSVGTMFDFLEKNDPADVLAEFKFDGPFDYEKVLPFKTEKELRKEGFGGKAVGGEVGVEDDDEDEDDDIPFEEDL